MKRFLALAVFPALLFALERVNLIKDAGFEKNSDVWQTYTESTGYTSVALVNRHDSEKAFTGGFSGSCDTRPVPEQPGVGYVEDAFLTRGFYPGKTLADLDTFYFNFSIEPFENDTAKTCIALALLYVNAGSPDYWEVGYLFRLPRIPIGSVPHLAFLEIINFPTDTLWHSLNRNIKEEISEKAPYIPLDATLDSVVLWSEGHRVDLPWQGQKVFFDDIRLIGWADYDIALTRLSGNLMHPAAIVWNNGREDQTDVKVICCIEGDRPEPYADTVILPSLASDDSLEVFFKENQWVSGSSDYYLTVVTGNLAGMKPDECDEDDLLTEYYPCGISEPVTQPESPVITLEVESFTANPKISYWLPANQSGTISIYDASGRRTESLRVQGSGEVGFPTVLSSGVYFVKLESGKTSVTRKAVILK